MGSIELAASVPVVNALVAAAALPFVLLGATRWPRVKGRNAVQFALSYVIVVLFWAVTTAITAADSPSAEIAVGLMLLAAAGLVYLEIWALMSRGYTLGILVTLLNADRPLSADDLAALYRQGSGLSWIMQHRVRGLIGAGLVRLNGDILSLTSFPGIATALLYRAVVKVLGLRMAG
jgi:hypothetical protein